jgi:hypothetical protein
MMTIGKVRISVAAEFFLSMCPSPS